MQCAQMECLTMKMVKVEEQENVHVIFTVKKEAYGFDLHFMVFGRAVFAEELEAERARCWE
eukprot:6175820-Pleurochrysis_carterae.AAC.3